MKIKKMSKCQLQISRLADIRGANVSKTAKVCLAQRLMYIGVEAQTVSMSYSKLK